MVRSQTASLTPSPSFGHNLCFRCPNEQWEPTLDIYVPRAFQWYKERYKPLSFDPSTWSLKFWESTGIPSPKVGVALGVWGFTPSHFPTLPGVCDVIPALSLGPHSCNPFALVASTKLGLRQDWCVNYMSDFFNCIFLKLTHAFYKCHQKTHNDTKIHGVKEHEAKD